MTDAMVSEEGSHGACTEEKGNCGSGFALFYFVSFQVLGSFVFLNLIVAVILENFASLHNLDPDLISAHDLDARSRRASSSYK